MTLSRAELISEFDTQINPDFPLKAAKTVGKFAKDKDDLLLLLDMLGLIPPQEGNKPKTQIEHRNELARERGRINRQNVREERETP